MYICEHYNKLPKRFHRGSIAIGNFDGMHTGHREVINKARLFSQVNRSPWGVLTFEPHPREIFNNSNIPFRLTPFEVKNREIAEMGIDFLVVVKFNLEFSQISAETFIRQILVENLKASYIVSGFNFGFGNNRAGNPKFLKTMGKKLGFKTAGAEPPKERA